MQVYRLLDLSNCGRCGEKTCLAFAASVYQGKRELSQCPFVGRPALEEFSGNGGGAVNGDAAAAELEKLRIQASALDFAETARRTGAVVKDHKLCVAVLGKQVCIDATGALYSMIHLNPWVVGPVLTYLCRCRGREVGDGWVSFRDIDGPRYPLFAKRCEESLKRVADCYTELFDDMVHLFQGREVPQQMRSDISVLLPLLPKVPLLIRYWRPDEGIESQLSVYFDASVEENLGADMAFTLATGLTQMFERLVQRHGKLRV
jgi:hypothetical protein